MYKLEMKKTFTDEDRSKINDVISQFFEEFNPKSSIDLKKGFCHILVLFEEPPKELIKKMMECNPDEFIYVESNTTNIVGKKQSDFDNSDKSEEETETDSEDSDESEEETETDSEDSDESEEESETDSSDSDESEEETETQSEASDESADKTPSTTNVNVKSKGKQITKCEEIKILSELAAKSSSYEEFINLISKEISFGKNETLFLKFINTAAENQDASLSSVSKKIGMTYSNLNCLNAKVSNYFKRKGERVTLGGFINEVVKYKDYSFETKTDNLEIKPDETTGVPVTAEQKVSESEENVADESAEQKVSDSKEDESSVSEENEVSGSAEQAVVKHEVPVIPEFEEFLGNIDKTLTIKERVEKVLNYMAPKLEDRIYEHHLIRNYMSAGVSLKVITHEAIMKKDKYILSEARMHTSKLIRAFINAKTKSSEPILAVDFLKYLQKFILTSDELRKL